MTHWVSLKHTAWKGIYSCAAGSSRVGSGCRKDYTIICVAFPLSFRYQPSLLTVCLRGPKWRMSTDELSRANVLWETRHHPYQQLGLGTASQGCEILSFYLSQESSKTEWVPLLESLFVTLCWCKLTINTALLWAHDYLLLLGLPLPSCVVHSQLPLRKMLFKLLLPGWVIRLCSRHGES